MVTKMKCPTGQPRRFWGMAKFVCCDRKFTLQYQISCHITNFYLYWHQGDEWLLYFTHNL